MQEPRRASQLVIGRHAPRRAPVDVGRIVFRVQFVLVIDKAVVAEAAIGAVLDQRRTVAVAPLVVFPTIGLLGRGLAPGEVVAEVPRPVGTHVACRPQGAAGKTQVHLFVVVRPGAVQQVINQAGHIADAHITVMVHIST